MGRTFGRLTVLSISWSGARPNALCSCACEPSKRTKPHPNKLLTGRSRSCGCFARELTRKRNVRHGMTVGYVQQPAYYLWHNARDRARKKNLPFNIELSDVVVPEKCPVLGTDIYTSAHGMSRLHSPSLDRLVPSLGYVKGNVRVISLRANSIKNDASPGELRKVADWLEREIAAMRQGNE